RGRVGHSRPTTSRPRTSLRRRRRNPRDSSGDGTPSGGRRSGVVWPRALDGVRRRASSIGARRRVGAGLLLFGGARRFTTGDVLHQYAQAPGPLSTLG